MKHSFAPLLLLVALTACNLVEGQPMPTKNVDAGALQEQATAAAGKAEMPAVDLGSLLGGVTDQASAESAKQPLGDAVGKLETALEGQKAKANLDAATSAAGGTSSSWSTDVLGKFGLGSGTADQIRALLANEQVKAVLGPTLEKLQGLLPGS